MMLLSAVDQLFYALLVLALYHFIGRQTSPKQSSRLFAAAFVSGPWYIGHLTDGYLGAAFFWGVLMQGIYQRTDMQPTMGTIQVESFYC